MEEHWQDGERSGTGLMDTPKHVPSQDHCTTLFREVDSEETTHRLASQALQAGLASYSSDGTQELNSLACDRLAPAHVMGIMTCQHTSL